MIKEPCILMQIPTYIYIYKVFHLIETLVAESSPIRNKLYLRHHYKIFSSFFFTTILMNVPVTRNQPKKGLSSTHYLMTKPYFRSITNCNILQTIGLGLSSDNASSIFFLSESKYICTNKQNVRFLADCQKYDFENSRPIEFVTFCNQKKSRNAIFAKFYCGITMNLYAQCGNIELQFGL